jgi:NADH-quinone oxidoreductase chain G
MMKKDRKRVKVYINDIEVSVLENSTVLQACEKIGVKVPRFCYHEKLSIAGNCRMCLVEIKNAPKLQASCALPVIADARIYTDTLAVRKAREGIMELLLINHPLDCPICDQGGECDLQDQAMYYGSDHGRFNEYKRATSNKNFGPLIKTIMNRCIHCTRCVRFATEIAGCPEVGTIGRGSNMEISTFNLNPSSTTNIDSIPQDFKSDYTKELAGVLDSELSGNLIDICPVGALTSLPYAFVARPWECKSIASIDVSDTYCSKIKLDLRGQGPGSILRVLPNDNSWISDKTRFSYDGLKRQRLVTPLSKSTVSGGSSFLPVTWDDISKNLEGLNTKAPTTIFVGNHVDYPSMESLAYLKAKNKNLNLIFINSDAARYNSNTNLTLQNLTQNLSETQGNTSLNNSFTFLKASDLEEADFCLLVGTNPRLESPVLNTAVQKIAKRGCVALIGSHATTLPYPVVHLGTSFNSLTKVLSQLQSVNTKIKGDHTLTSKSSKVNLITASSFDDLLNNSKLHDKLLKKFKQSQRKLIIVGSSILHRPDCAKLLDSLSLFVKQSKQVSPLSEISEVNSDSSVNSSISLHFLYQSVSELNAYKANLDPAKLNAEGYANLLNSFTDLNKSSELANHSIASLNGGRFIYYNLPTYALNHPVIKFSLNLKDVFRIYIGSHGNSLTGVCDLILPVTTYTEKETIYYNTFGEQSLSSVVTYPPGHAVADSILFNKLKEYLI